jgi:hypothetical protein
MAPLSPSSKIRSSALFELYEETILTRLCQYSGNFANGNFEDHELSEASTALRLGQNGEGLLTLLSKFRGLYPRPKGQPSEAIYFQVKSPAA